MCKLLLLHYLLFFLSFLSLKNFNRIEDCYSFSGGSLHFFIMKLLRGISFLTLLGKSFWALTWSVTIKDYKKLIAIYIIDVDICCSNDRVVDRKNLKQNVPRNQNYISFIVKIEFTYMISHSLTSSIFHSGGNVENDPWLFWLFIYHLMLVCWWEDQPVTLGVVY